MELNAVPRFISGKVSASPARAYPPANCPMKMLSTRLYNEEQLIAMMEGTAYCLSSLDIFSEPSCVGIPACILIYSTLFL
jgi:hypothetical protein